MAADVAPDLAPVVPAARAGWRGPGRRVGLEVAVGTALVALAALAAVLAPWIAPYDPLAQDVARRLRPPGFVDSHGGSFWLGTDGLGRDVLSRLLQGARVSLLVGIVAAGVSGAVGTALGLTAGYFGGWWDALVMRLVDVWQAIPYLVLALAVAVVLGPGLVTLVMVLALTTWTIFARVVRAEVLAQRHSQLVVAARVTGAGAGRILAHHVLPQVASSVMVLASLMVGSMILFEASLSFLGVGVPPPTASWGNMVLDGVAVVRTAWWVSVFPGLAILLTVLGVNLIGDGLRDALDPRRGF